MSWIKDRITQVIADYRDPPVASESLSVRPGTVVTVEKRDIIKQAFDRAAAQQTFGAEQQRRAPTHST